MRAPSSDCFHYRPSRLINLIGTVTWLIQLGANTKTIYPGTKPLLCHICTYTTHSQKFTLVR
jgi:hypothetical protein